MDCQRHLFQLSDEVTYLNGAYMSPMLRSVEEAGHQAMIKKRNPYEYTLVDFFDKVIDLKERFAQLVGGDMRQVAITPSTSYGMANAAANIKSNGRKKIIVAGEQFPSNYYVWERYAREHDGEVVIIDPTPDAEHRGASWNENILSVIDDDTIAVAISHVHWADGTIFSLSDISARCRHHGALLIVDATQSLGILPFDIHELGVDVLIASGYKCLMGPYGMGYAYYSKGFDDGLPIEDSWINRVGSDDFARLVDYQPEYRDGAMRYDVGEASSFINIAMSIAALDQLLAWGAAEMQSYCREITSETIASLRSVGYWIEEDDYRASHLFGVRPPSHISMDTIKEKLTAESIMVSYRGSALRVSPSVYNTNDDVERLGSALIGLI